MVEKQLNCVKSLGRFVAVRHCEQIPSWYRTEQAPLGPATGQDGMPGKYVRQISAGPPEMHFKKPKVATGSLRVVMKLQES